MPEEWQKINGGCLYCHSWQDPPCRRLNAMIYLYLLLLITLAMVVGTLRLVVRDGRGPSLPPRSHHDDVFTPRRQLVR
jgi:hypothetical protein